VILADSALRNTTQNEFLDRVNALDPGIRVLLVAPRYATEAAVEAINHGAWDYLTKPIEMPRLAKVLDEITQEADQRRRVHALDGQLLEHSQFHGILGESPAMRDLYDGMRKAARHYANLLILGPPGSGRELVARALHQLSPSAQQRFAVCDCSGLSDLLLESQLFGHVRGAFPGAAENRAGLFEYAEGGAIFLDEIGAASAAVQAKLARLVQNREIQRLGATEVKRVNIRLIAAGGMDLAERIKEGKFREDLYRGLSVLELRVPPLAERLEDIPLLVRHFLKKYAEICKKSIKGITRRAQIALREYDWPGNVRELEGALSSAAVVTLKEFIDIQDLPEFLRGSTNAPAPPPEPERWHPAPLDDVRRAHIERVLQSCNGNRVRASQILGIGRTSLYRYLKRTGQTTGNGKAKASHLREPVETHS
jgi:DNA-binding NtrC family response regulator